MANQYTTSSFKGFKLDNRLYDPLEVEKWLKRRGKIIISSLGCWQWQASKCRGGYGRASFGGKVQLVHRIVYLLCMGNIPNGYQFVSR